MFFEVFSLYFVLRFAPLRKNTWHLNRRHDVILSCPPRRSLLGNPAPEIQEICGSTKPLSPNVVRLLWDGRTTAPPSVNKSNRRATDVYSGTKSDSVRLTANDIFQEIVGYLCFIRIRTIRKISGMFINIPKLMVDDLELSDLHDSVWISRKQC